MVPGFAGKVVYRTAFAHQMADLPVGRRGAVVARAGVALDRLRPPISSVGSFTVPTCRFARAYRCWLLPEGFARGIGFGGYDEMAERTFFYGLGARLPARLCWPGGIRSTSLTSANAHEPSR